MNNIDYNDDNDDNDNDIKNNNNNNTFCLRNTDVKWMALFEEGNDVAEKNKSIMFPISYVGGILEEK